MSWKSSGAILLASAVLLLPLGCRPPARPAGEAPSQSASTSSANTPVAGDTDGFALKWEWGQGYRPVESRFRGIAMSGDGSAVYSSYPAVRDHGDGKVLWEGPNPDTRVDDKHPAKSGPGGINTLLVTLASPSGIVSLYQPAVDSPDSTVIVWREYPLPSKRLGEVPRATSLLAVDDAGDVLYFRNGGTFEFKPEVTRITRVRIEGDALSVGSVDVRQFLSDSGTVGSDLYCFGAVPENYGLAYHVQGDSAGNHMACEYRNSDGTVQSSFAVRATTPLLQDGLGERESVAGVSWADTDPTGRWVLIEREVNVLHPGQREATSNRTEYLMVDMTGPTVAWVMKSPALSVFHPSSAHSGPLFGVWLPGTGFAVNVDGKGEYVSQGATTTLNPDMREIGQLKIQPHARVAVAEDSARAPYLFDFAGSAPQMFSLASLFERFLPDHGPVSVEAVSASGDAGVLGARGQLYVVGLPLRR